MQMRKQTDGEAGHYSDQDGEEQEVAILAHVENAGEQLLPSGEHLSARLDVGGHD